MPSPELNRRLARVRLAIFDVDGVLTDGTLGPAQEPGRRWSVHDGFGFVLARRSGLRFALCSGHDHPEIRSRAERLGLDTLLLGCMEKGGAIAGLMAERNLERGEAIFVGDDLFDLAGMTAAGLGAAPADARPQVRAAADWPLVTAGGRGAAREVIDGLLLARGEWDDAVRGYLEESGG